jgi:hypothetical protein
MLLSAKEKFGLSYSAKKLVASSELQENKSFEIRDILDSSRDLRLEYQKRSTTTTRSEKWCMYGCMYVCIRRKMLNIVSLNVLKCQLEYLEE